MKKSFALAVATANAVSVQSNRCACAPASQNLDWNLGRRHTISLGGEPSRKTTIVRSTSPLGSSAVVYRENKSNLGLDNALDAPGIEVLGAVNVLPSRKFVAPATKTIVEEQLIPARRDWQGLGSHHVNIPQKTLKMGGKKPEVLTTTTTEFIQDPSLGYEIREIVSPSRVIEVQETRPAAKQIFEQKYIQVEPQPASQIIEVMPAYKPKQPELEMPDLDFDFNLGMLDGDIGRKLAARRQMPKPELFEYIFHYDHSVNEVDFVQTVEDAFILADLNGDGYLSRAEAQSQTEGFKEFMGIGFDAQAFQKEFAENDKNCDGLVSEREFIDRTYYVAKEKGMFIVSKLADAFLLNVSPENIMMEDQEFVWWIGFEGLQCEPEFLQSLKNLFVAYDWNNDNLLSEDEAYALTADSQKYMGRDFNKSLFYGFFIDADHNDNGEITFSEFAVMNYNYAKDRGMALYAKYFSEYEQSLLAGPGNIGSAVPKC